MPFDVSLPNMLQGTVSLLHYLEETLLLPVPLVSTPDWTQKGSSALRMEVCCPRCGLGSVGLDYGSVRRLKETSLRAHQRVPAGRTVSKLPDPGDLERRRGAGTLLKGRRQGDWELRLMKRLGS